MPINNRNKWLILVVLSAASFAAMPLFAAQSSATKHPPTARLVYPFTKADKPAYTIVTDIPNTVVERISPDHRYVARIICGDAELGYLYVRRAGHGSRNGFMKHYRLEVDNVSGCLWLPYKGHTLAYSSGGADYGRGYVGIWNGRNHVLRRAKSDVGEEYRITSYDWMNRTLKFDYIHEGFWPHDSDTVRHEYIAISRRL